METLGILENKRVKLHTGHKVYKGISLERQKEQAFSHSVTFSNQCSKDIYYECNVFLKSHFQSVGRHHQYLQDECLMTEITSKVHSFKT